MDPPGWAMRGLIRCDNISVDVFENVAPVVHDRARGHVKVTENRPGAAIAVGKSDRPIQDSLVTGGNAF